MKLFLFCLILGMMPCAYSQSTGINYRAINSIGDVLQAAKIENKPIFIDFYATWCGPCKVMDHDVYSKQEVYQYINSNFIPIKIQVDSTSSDNSIIKGQYNLSRKLVKENKIKELPTIIFLTQEDSLIDRQSGTVGITQLLQILSEAKDNSKQYYPMVRKYFASSLDDTNVIYLIDKSNRKGNIKMIDSITDRYILQHDNLFSSKFIKSHVEITKALLPVLLDILPTTQKFISQIISSRIIVDSVMNDTNYCNNLVSNFIYLYRLSPTISKLDSNSADPNWVEINNRLVLEYGEPYTQNAIVYAKVYWYKKKHNWAALSEYTVKQIEIDGVDTSGINKLLLNNKCYDIVLKYSDNKQDIAKAISWMKMIVDSRPHDADYIDTYANLLYKYGNTQEALLWEQRAQNILPNNTDIKIAVSKMKEGLPTWK